MAPSNFFRLFTILSLAILNISFDALPANALAIEPGHMARGVNHAHAGIAKKRNSSKQCKPRPIPSASASISSTLSTTSHHPPVKYVATHLATPTSTPSSQLSTSTSHSSTPSAAASSGGACSQKKHALAWSNNEEGSLHNFVTPCIRYIYNWQVPKYPTAFTAFPQYNQLVYVPTLGSRKELFNNIHMLTRGYASIVKTFNEPNIVTQANIPYQEACSLWQQYIQPLTLLGYTLVSPSVTTDTTGWIWMQEFTKCPGITIHTIDIHHYSLDATGLINSINQYYQTYGKPIWVSEYGCKDYSGQNQPCTTDIYNTFYQTAVGFMDSCPFVEMHAFFGFFRAEELPNGVDAINSMMTCPQDLSNCTPNSHGYQFLNP